MEIIELLVIVAIAITFSNIFSKVVPTVPVFLAQIFLGILLGMTKYASDIAFEPEIFLIMIIAPLLFREGEAADVPEVLKNFSIILFLAFGLVIGTLVIIGLTLKTLLPSIPLAACFAFGAALGPTDAVAVGSLAKRLKIPPRVLHILEGEGLLNDASGVTAFQFAVAALVTGAFSLVNASFSLLLSSVIGAVAGFVVVWIKNRIIKLIERISAQDVIVYLLIELLLPFVAYLLAEMFHASGIIAAVVAGVLQSMGYRKVTLFEAELANISDSTWKTISFTLNSLVFLFLGIELSQVFSPIWKSQEYANMHLVFVILVIAITLILIRLVGISLFFGFTKGFRHLKEKFREILMLTFGGVKGTVSLATIFILPVSINGLDFDQRPLLLFLTACVIMVSLVGGMIALPLLSDGEAEKPIDPNEVAILNEVIENLHQDIDDASLEETEVIAIEAVMDHYHSRVWELYTESMTESEQQEVQEIQALILAIEQEGLEESYRKGEISMNGYRLYSRFLKRYETSFKRQVFSFFSFSLVFWRRMIRIVLHPKRFWQSTRADTRLKIIQRDVLDVRKVFLQNNELVLQSLSTLEDIFEPTIVQYYLRRREDMKKQIQHVHLPFSFTVQQEPAYAKEILRGYYLERKIIDEYEVSDKITLVAANEYRQKVNLLESYALQQVKD
ncbi:Na+/H+ antiporter [Enterococcus sp. AZ150]|uniref:cation:proton antiporter n=1 Tax=Enterococcus sp. AZ150 TaxID=2774866 RepID=UPI003F20619B